MGKKRLLKILKWFVGIILGFVMLISAVLYFFKDDIIALVIDEVNDHLKTKVSVSKVDLTFWGTFPNLSVDFNNVFIQDSYENATERDTLLFSEQIRLKFSPLDIWRENYTVKKISIAPGTLQLKVNDAGEINYDIFKPSEDSTKTDAFDFKLESISINDIRFVYDNQSVKQRYATDISEMQLVGKMSEQVFTLGAVSKLFIKEAKSGEVNLLSNKEADLNIAIEVNQNTHTFTIPAADILIANLPFMVDGKVTSDSLDFHISGKKLALADVATNFSMQQVDHVKRFEGSGTVNFQLDIDGALSSKNPVTINCDFGIKNGQLTEPVKRQKLRNIQLNGKYSNKGGPTEEYLSLQRISFNTSTGPFSGSVIVSNFSAPIIKGLAKGDLDLNVIHSLFHLPSIDKIDGNLGVNTNFTVQAHPQENETFLYEIFKCEGQAEFKKVGFQLVDDKRYFNQINGNVFLLNDKAGIEHISLKLGNSDMMLNGAFTNVISYFKKEQNLRADLVIVSKNIAIEDLGTTAKEVQLQEARTNMFPDNIIGSVDLSVGNLSYEGHRFELITGLMNINGRTLTFPSLGFRSSGATIEGSLVIEERSPEVFNVTTQLASSNINIKQVFKDWNNFKQDVIRADHISGNAAINLFLEAPFDLRSGVFFKSVKSDIQLKITDGRLKGVETFASIVKSLKTPAAKLAIGAKNIASLESKLSDLKFETLENHIVIRNGIIELPLMKINSSALNIETYGTHSFDNAIDYHFAFRFRDLKITKDSEFGNVVDDGTGANIYMRMYGTMDNPIIEWDKAASKEDRQEYNEKEKENFKSMLKSDFGVFANDTNVKAYKTVVKPKETLEVQYGKDTTSVDNFEKEKKEKNGKFSKWLKSMEEESKQKNKVNVEFD